MQILKLTNNRIYFEEDKYYKINSDIIYEFSLKKGMELSEKKEKELFIALILYKSYDFLSRKDYSKKELKLKLFGEFSKTAPIEEVLEILEEKSYIDDFSYARNYISSKNLSKKKIYFDLIQKGVKKEIIDDIYTSVEIDEKEDIRKIIVKLDKKEDKKKIEYLLRKGYNLQDILDVLKNINDFA